MLIITHNITKITEINISLCLPTELKTLSVEKYIQLYICSDVDKRREYNTTHDILWDGELDLQKLGFYFLHNKRETYKGKLQK